MTEAEARKANFIDSEMQDRYYRNGEKFTVEDVEYAYDSGVTDGKRNVRDRLIEIVRPPKDVDSIYLDVICLIGEIE